MTSRTFSFTVPGTPTGGGFVPNWFAGSALAPLTWTTVAGSTSTQTLSAAAIQAGYVWPTDPTDPLTPASPVIGPQSFMNSASNYCQNSNGMAVDATTGECFIVSAGGHGGYMGNETMRLNLRSNTPAWERYIDSTPPWHISTRNGLATGQFLSPEEEVYGLKSYLCYTDGPDWLANPITYGTTTVANSAITRRPMSTHTSCLPTYSNGKVWFGLQNSSNAEGGSSSFSQLAMNIDSVRADSSLRRWKYGDIRPWEFLGVMSDETYFLHGDQALFLFPTAALDTTTGRIWICPATPSSMHHFWMLETRGPNAGRHQIFNSTTLQLRTQGAVGGDITTNVVDTTGTSLKLFVLYGRRQFARDVYVLNISALEQMYPTIPYSGILETETTASPAQKWNQYLANDETPMLWVNLERFGVGEDPSGTWGPQQAWGCFWHEGSKGLLMFNCDHAVGSDRKRNGHIRKLAFPMNGLGRYDPSLPWVYRDIPIAGPVPTTCSPTGGLVTGGSFTRFNVMRNFDSLGNDLVISVNSWQTAVSVMKLPQAGV